MTQMDDQYRESLESTGYRLHKRINQDEVVLTSDASGLELWCRAETYASGCIDIEGSPYQFVATVTAAEVMGLTDTGN